MSNRYSLQDKNGGIKMYAVFMGEVASVQPYGVFVKIPFTKKSGLVHKSQMSSTYVEKPEEMCSVGDQVWCKIIAMEGDGEKIGLSMKVVNQTTGQDSDPNHVQTSIDEQRRKTGHKRDIPKIELGAVFDTTCKKCGGKGHIAGDCFHVPGSKTYDLLPDVDIYLQQQAQEQKAARKKAKKDKKAKKKKHKTKDSDSDEESRKKKKKSKKKSKKKQSSSESDSESEEDSDAKESRKKKKKSKKKSKKKQSSTESDSESEEDSDSKESRKKKKKSKKKSKKKQSSSESDSESEEDSRKQKKPKKRKHSSSESDCDSPNLDKRKISKSENRRYSDGSGYRGDDKVNESGQGGRRRSERELSLDERLKDHKRQLSHEHKERRTSDGYGDRKMDRYDAENRMTGRDGEKRSKGDGRMEEREKSYKDRRPSEREMERREMKGGYGDLRGQYKDDDTRNKMYGKDRREREEGRSDKYREKR